MVAGRGERGGEGERRTRPWPHRGCRVTAVGLGEEVEDVAAEGKKASGGGGSRPVGGCSGEGELRAATATGRSATVVSSRSRSGSGEGGGDISGGEWVLSVSGWG